MKQAEKDTVRETLILNGKEVKQDFWKTENMIVDSILKLSTKMTRKQAQGCAIDVFCLTNRTCGGAESLFVMHQLFQQNNPNILIKCVTQPEPTQINFSKRKGSGKIIVKTRMSYRYGLYKVDELDAAADCPPAWIHVDAVVHGQIRFTPWDYSSEQQVSTQSMKYLELANAEQYVELPSSHSETAEIF
jgi:hypothetical protein